MKLRLVTTICTIASAMMAAAQVPNLINYQGRLTDASGAPVTGSKNFSISIYDAATAGNLLYTETIGAVTLDTNGVYSFQFGSAGTSNTRVTETVATTNGTATTFQRFLANSLVLAGSVSITDGTYTWSQSAGSSSEDDFGVAYSTSLRRVTINYYNGAPATGRTITATYRYGTSGITGALSSGAEHWMAVSVEGTPQATRQRVIAVPFAHFSAQSHTSQSSAYANNSGSADAASGSLAVTISNLNRDLALVAAGIGSQNIFSEKFTVPSGSAGSVVPTETTLNYRNSFYTAVTESTNVSGLSVPSFEMTPSIGKVRGITVHYVRSGGGPSSHWARYDYNDGTFDLLPNYPFEGGSTYVPNPKPSKIVSKVTVGTSGNSGRYTVILRENGQGVLKITLPSTLNQQASIGLFLGVQKVGSGDLIQGQAVGENGNLPLTLDGYTSVPPSLGRITHIIVSATSADQSLEDITKINALVLRYTE